MRSRSSPRGWPRRRCRSSAFGPRKGRSDMREPTSSSATGRRSSPRVDLLLRRTRSLDALRGRYVHANLLPDETLLRRRPLYFAAALLALLSLPFQQPLLFIASLLVGALA